MYRLLLVEDDESIVKSLTEYLVREGFFVDSADGQKEAQTTIITVTCQLRLF